MNMETFQEGFGWTALGINCISFIFPMLPFLNVIKGKLNFESTPIYSISLNYVNYFCWFIYGNMIFNDQLKYCFLSGSIISGISIFIYLVQELRKYLVEGVLDSVIFFAGTWAIYRVLVIIIDDDRIIGRICLITSFIMLLSSFRLIYKVIKDKNYEYIPILNYYFSFFYSVCWIVYSIFLTDFCIFFPYTTFALISLILIFLYHIYKRTHPIIDKKGIDLTIGIEDISHDTKKIDEPIMKLENISNKISKEEPVLIAK